jgi:hypothetical protein
MKAALRLSTLVLAAILLAGMASQAADESAAKPVAKQVAIPAGSTLRVKLGTTLTDKTNQSGDAFTGQVMQPIMVDGQEVVPAFSSVKGHVAFLKPSGRVKGVAQMRIVLDSLTTTEDVVYPLSGALEEAHGGACAETNVASKANKKAANQKTTEADEEGTITGCGKNKKDAAKDAALGGAIGAMGGLAVGMAGRGGCDYYGCYPQQGPGMGTSIGVGAGIGAGTTLLYNLLKHEKHIVLVEGTQLVFVVNRSTTADLKATAAAAAESQALNAPAPADQ